MSRSSVVLPDPDGPSSARSSPPPTSRSTSSTAVNEPKRLVTPRTVILILDIPFSPAFHSMPALAAIVTSATTASTEATANAAAKLYSL